MKNFLHNRSFYIVIAIVVIIIAIVMARLVSNRNNTELITAMVEIGPVKETVSVSGIAKAEQTAELAFPVTGIVAKVFVSEGDYVETGDTLITLESQALYADRLDALASLDKAIANRDELLRGPTDSALDVTAETLVSKEAALATTKENEAQKVANAYKALLSNDLVAYSTDPNEDAVAPVVSGAYNCSEEGTYTIEVFSSKANSGYSYYLSGLETGTQVASVEQSTPMGNCGLRLLFDENSIYSNSEWEIDIPNTKSSTYVSYRNAYTLATTQADSAIALAEQDLSLAKSNATNQNAPARSEAVSRANADVAQAQARVAKIDATIADRSIKAPFAGIITDISVLPGETVSPTPVITLLASDEFEVTARIPEIDVGRLSNELKVEMVFDAKSDETVTGSVVFISPQATEIDGVAYYEAHIKFDETPTWIKSGLNADIEIVIKETDDGLRIPRRFLTKNEGRNEVLLLNNGSIATTTVRLVLEGNDGYVSITGLNEGDVIVAP